MDPLTIALLSSAVSAGGSALGGLFGKKPATPKPQWLTPPETELGKTKKNLVDDLLASLKGNGSFNDLFNGNQEAFQKSFVDPAKNLFNNQIAPQIQQNAIYSGQQRGSGLDDTLARAGVNLDDMLNSHYAQFQQNAQNNQMNGISQILGQGEPQAQLYTGGNRAQSSMSGIGQGIAGFFGGGGAQNSIDNILRNTKGGKARTGFQNDNNGVIS